MRVVIDAPICPSASGVYQVRLQSPETNYRRTNVEGQTIEWQVLDTEECARTRRYPHQG